MNISFALVPFALVAACSTTHDSVGDATAAKAQFDLIHSLEGTWTAKGEHDGQTMESETQFHATGAGTTMMETLFKGQPHEMVSMYHVDGGRLMHTHYCAAGNQPRMIALPGGAKGEIAFEFSDATNMPSPNATHMHRMRMVVHDADHVEEWWQGFSNGAKEHEAHFMLTRKKS